MEHSATSPKRRDQQRQSFAFSETSLPWTATRCHRLLRPLLAHVASLRKVKERRALTHNVAGSAALGRTTRPRRTVLGKRSYPADDSDYDDKKPCRKYSRKASRRASSSSSGDPSSTPQKQRRQPDNKASQDLALPTPLLRRVRNHQQSSPQRGPDEKCLEEPAPTNGRCLHQGSCGRSSRCAFEAELASLRPTMDGEKFGLYESAIKAFDSLLRVTSPRKDQAAGSKSLLAMCLRKVPAYIAALEEWEAKDAEENGERPAAQGAGMSFEVYSDLESLGPFEGWKHLSFVVRAHGVKIIQDAASEGLLEDPVTDMLIRLCLEYMPFTECLGLINTFVVRQYPKPNPSDNDLFASPPLRPLRVLRSCRASSSTLLQGILADLLADGLLPADWILTKSFMALWPPTVRLITEMKPCQDTADFVIITLEQLCNLASPRRPRGVPQTRLRGKPQNTLISAIAALGSVVLLSEEGSSQGPGPSSAARAATLKRRIEYVVKTCSENLKRQKKGGKKLGTYLLALCSFLSLETGSASAVIEASWEGVQNCRGNNSLMLQYDATTALMSAMAHYCSRGTGLAPNVYLSQFCDKLETLRLPNGALRNMRVDGALRLAELTGDLRDLAFAESLRAKLKAAATNSTPKWTRRSSTDKKHANSFSGIRWDDGISEWVAATPATDQLTRPTRSKGVKRPAPSSEDDSHSYSDSDTARTPDSSASSLPLSQTAADELDLESLPVGDRSDECNATTSGGFETLEGDESSAPSPRSSSIAPSIQAESEPDPASNEHQPATRTRDDEHSSPSPLPPPPTPPGGFLATRPRRLSRRIIITQASDVLALDSHARDSEDKENWLCRKKPARFRPAANASAAAAGGAAPHAVVRKRVARASLVYLQPIERTRTTAKGDEHHAEGQSDDELSIL